MPTEAGGSSLWSTRAYLREVQYATPSNLDARQALYAYQQPRLPWYDWVLDLADLDGDESILDVGCGSGPYLATLCARGHRGLAAGLDFSIGMLEAARVAGSPGSAHPVVHGDAAALPIATAGVDVAMAMHMLYHVPEPLAALHELRRVTRPGGTVLVVLNIPGHLAELDRLVGEAAAAAGLAARSMPPDPLDLPAGRALALQVFANVEVHEVRSELVVPDVDPVVAYVGSMGSALATPGVDALLDHAGRIVADKIAADGAFRVTTASGCLVCR